MKKFLSVCLSIILLWCAVPAYAYSFIPSEDLTSGMCGENVSYDFNKETGVLTLSGIGAMYDYSSNREDAVNPSPFFRDKNGVEINSSIIKKLIIEDGITYIGSYAFIGRRGLTEVEMGNSVLSIGINAFSNSGVKDIKLSNELVSIGSRAFSGTWALETISLPNSLRSIGSGVFSGSGITEIEIPESVCEIPSNAFSFSFIKKISVPDSVYSIGASAFTGCEDLSLVTLGKNVQSIGTGAFRECESLFSITINSNFVYIGDNAFAETPIRNVYFAGTKAAWYEDISKSDYSIEEARKGFESTVIHCIDGDIKFLKKYSIENNYVKPLEDKTYTGKALTQNIYVSSNSRYAGPDDERLQEGVHYSVSYRNNLKVGIATVIIKGKGKYEGSITKTFKINPKGTSIKELFADKKGFTAVWKKQQTQTSGYQLQYAANSYFTMNKKTVTINDTKKSKKSIKNLSAKKKYYVRIRTYKVVDGKKYYSKWSEAKKITTKK
jgi:hypothetical protein